MVAEETGTYSHTGLRQRKEERGESEQVQGFKLARSGCWPQSKEPGGKASQVASLRGQSQQQEMNRKNQKVPFCDLEKNALEGSKTDMLKAQMG